MCVQFTVRMEVIVVAQRNALICPITNRPIWRTRSAKLFSGKGTYRSKQLPHYIPGIRSSDVLSKPWRHFVNKLIIQPHVDQNTRVRSDDDSRSSPSEDEGCDEESASAPAGGDSSEVPAMSMLQPTCHLLLAMTTIDCFDSCKSLKVKAIKCASFGAVKAASLSWKCSRWSQCWILK